MSAFPLKGDIRERDSNVRQVPKGDISPQAEGPGREREPNARRMPQGLGTGFGAASLL